MNRWSSQLFVLTGLILSNAAISQAQVLMVYGAPQGVYVPNQSVVAYQPVYSQPAYVAASPVVSAAYASPVVLAPRPIVAAAPVYSPSVVVPAGGIVVAGVRPTVVRESVRYQPHGYNYSVHSHTRGLPASTYRLHVNEHRNGVTVRERIR